MLIQENQKGATLVEVLVATLLMTIAFIPLISSLLGGHNLAYKGRDYITANNLAIQAIEQLKAAPYYSIAPDGRTIQNYPDIDSDFLLERRIKTVDQNNARLKRVDLTVYRFNKPITTVNLILYEKGL